MTAAAVLLAASALASAPAGAAAGRPPLALSASPTRVEVRAGAWTSVRVRNPGRSAVVVDVATAGFALDPRGRPRIASAQGAGRWLALAPRRLSLAAGRSAAVTVTALVPRWAAPGEHDALVLLRTRPQAGSPVPIVMQVGVVVAVRVRGRVVRSIDVRGLRVVRRRRLRTIVLTVRNRGNVSEVLPRRRVRIVLRRKARILATLLPPRRRILPHGLAVMTLPYRGGARGIVRAVVSISSPRPGVAVLRRSFRLRL
ncbi:MAG TPA: hypothetical protein VH538_01970 [Gaiellaceae bacterium]